jgi:hypothetical protein
VIEERLARLSPEGWDPPAPPPLRVPAVAPAPAPAPWRRRLALRPAVALAAACALLGLGLVAGLLVAGTGDGGPGAAPASRLALSAVAPAGGRAHGNAELVRGAHPHLVLDVRGLRPSRGGYYEVWLMNSGKDLVSLGGFRVGTSGRARVDVPVPVAARRYRAVDVSAEPDDGNPAHSAVSVLRGPLT